jgi:anaerobic selenocysteine-containing dehydrogenase
VCSLPDHNALLSAWRKLRLTVQIVTKLNRSCLVHGEASYILPCLGRIEIDTQASGPQAVSIEDSTACIHGSRGVVVPCSDDVRSEPWIIAGLAKATLPNPEIEWDAWAADYGRIRDAIAQTYPDIFQDFNRRMWQPGGFHRPLAARERRWLTKTGNANFITPKTKATAIDFITARRGVLQLTTIRRQGQFNTTVYADRDRYRGIFDPAHEPQ